VVQLTRPDLHRPRLGVPDRHQHVYRPMRDARDLVAAIHTIWSRRSSRRGRPTWFSAAPLLRTDHVGVAGERDRGWGCWRPRRADSAHSKVVPSDTLGPQRRRCLDPDSGRIGGSRAQNRSNRRTVETLHLVAP
jgi:hypothetical protein